MLNGRAKRKISLALDPKLVRALDARARSQGVSRSATAEEAMWEGLRIMVEAERETLNWVGVGYSSGRDEAVEEARITAGMVLQALRYQFPALANIGDEELRRRALEAQRKGESGGA